MFKRPHLARRTQVLAMAALLFLGGCAPKVVPTEQSFTLLDGTLQNFQALRGKPVLVNFWATTCAVCVRDMPQLVALHQRFQARGLQTLAVAMRHDPPALVAEFARRKPMPFGVVIDNLGALEQAFGGVQGTPTFFLVDKNGVVLQRIEGEPDFSALAARVERLLK